MRLQEISILIFFLFYCNINRNQLQIVVETTYGLNPYSEKFQKQNLKFWEEVW